MKVQNREIYRDRKVDCCLRMREKRKGDMGVIAKGHELSFEMMKCSKVYCGSDCTYPNIQKNS